MKYYIGIDLGGTNIKAGVVNEEFEIIAKATCKTNLPRPAEEICEDMAKVALEAVKNAGLEIEQIESVGIGTPGTRALLSIQTTLVSLTSTLLTL